MNKRKAEKLTEKLLLFMNEALNKDGLQPNQAWFDFTEYYEVPTSGGGKQITEEGESRTKFKSTHKINDAEFKNAFNYALAKGLIKRDSFAENAMQITFDGKYYAENIKTDWENFYEILKNNSIKTSYIILTAIITAIITTFINVQTGTYVCEPKQEVTQNNTKKVNNIYDQQQAVKKSSANEEKKE